MSIETMIPILSPLIAGLGVAWSLFITFFLNEKWKKNKKIREIHCGNLVPFLRIVRDTHIEYHWFSYRISQIDEIDKKLLDWTKQHLKSYKDASQNWESLNHCIGEMNNDLHMMEQYITDKINRVLNKENAKLLISRMSIISNYFISRQLENLDSIELKDNGKIYEICISTDKKTWSSIPYNGEKQNFEKLLNDFFNDEILITQLTKLRERKENIDILFQDLKSNLNDILRLLENGYEYKGKCDGCPQFWTLK